jgi:hypothetical protein
MVRTIKYTGIALTLESEMDIIDMCIKTNPACTKVADRHANLPYITALRNRTISWTINKISKPNPGAVLLRNFHGDTPLDGGTQRFLFDKIVDHLQRLPSGIRYDASHLKMPRTNSGE